MNYNRVSFIKGNNLYMCARNNTFATKRNEYAKHY